MMKELEATEPYEISAGCPTITFELTEESLMLPWSSFGCGSFKYGEITLTFQQWKVRIEGAGLEEVWKLLQMQDLRLLRSSGESTGAVACQINAITAQREVAEKMVAA